MQGLGWCCPDSLELVHLSQVRREIWNRRAEGSLYCSSACDSQTKPVAFFKWAKHHLLRLISFFLSVRRFSRRAQVGLVQRLLVKRFPLDKCALRRHVDEPIRHGSGTICRTRCLRRLHAGRGLSQLCCVFEVVCSRGERSCARAPTGRRAAFSAVRVLRSTWRWTSSPLQRPAVGRRIDWVDRSSTGE